MRTSREITAMITIPTLISTPVSQRIIGKERNYERPTKISVCDTRQGLPAQYTIQDAKPTHPDQI